LRHGDKLIDIFGFKLDNWKQFNSRYISLCSPPFSLFLLPQDREEIEVLRKFVSSCFDLEEKPRPRHLVKVEVDCGSCCGRVSYYMWIF